jgi:hypothetical protein
VPCCRMVWTQSSDCCGCCRSFCQPVVEWQTVTRTVMRQVPQTQEVTVNVCSYQQQQRTGMRVVQEMVPQTQEVTVNVCSYQ